MAKATTKGAGKPSIIIRKEEVVEGGHHGGAWKVAYADFVTAMMAFFLLMWLLNATTEDQRRGLADYFSPTNVLARGSSGFGAPFGGHTPNDDGSLASDRGSVQLMNATAKPVFEVEPDDSDIPAQAAAAQVNGASPMVTRQLQNIQPGGPAAKAPVKPGDQAEPSSVAMPEAQKKAEQERRAEQDKLERASFQQAAQQMRELISHDPGLADLAKQISVDITPEGLRIQILDTDGLPMFATGSAVLNDRARALLQKIVPVLMKLPEKLSITGHTDATPYRGTGERSNWELSADRANATRRLFADSGLPESRVQVVTGRADRDPLLPADPLAAANRRIAIVVLRDAAANPKL
jgi:chemotaxis protein MotB